MENSHKSYNNPGSWNSFESDGKRKIISETEVDTIKQVLGDSLVEMLPDEEIHNDNFETKLNPESVETELVETEDYDPSEERDLTNEEVNEVLQLTSYEDNQLIPSQHNNQYGIAEYKEIDIEDVSAKHQKEAKTFIDKVTKFVIEFNDVELTDAHKSLIKITAQFQLSHLSDLLFLVDANKQMINNIIRRVNATMTEDYAIIAAYNNLINQHLKLIKELSNSYRSVPSILKKMRADIICDQQLEQQENPNGEEVITKNFGDSQFNSDKQLYRKMLEARNKQKSQNQESVNN